MNGASDIVGGGHIKADLSTVKSREKKCDAVHLQGQNGGYTGKKNQAGDDWLRRGEGKNETAKEEGEGPEKISIGKERKNKKNRRLRGRSGMLWQRWERAETFEEGNRGGKETVESGSQREKRRWAQAGNTLVPNKKEVARPRFKGKKKGTKMKKRHGDTPDGTTDNLDHRPEVSAAQNRKGEQPSGSSEKAKSR